jgi:TolB-like protein/tetratricopeptide (TPR) repeat protein
MERDEAGAFARLREIRERTIDPKIAEHGGRVVKTAGDGMLLEFGSADAALRCAIDVQRAMGADNQASAPDERIEFRIGINLGDIIVDGTDIAGDGVNVAARLEALAEPGGICVSAAVREQVHGSLDVGFDDIGEQQVKNITRPIRVFRVILVSAATAGSIPARGKSVPRALPRRRLTYVASAAALLLILGAVTFMLNGGPIFERLRPNGGKGVQPPTMSVAVLPFGTLGTTVADNRLGETISRDLAAGIGRSLRSAKVVSDGRVSGYKDKAIDARAAGRELNVRYLVVGDIRPVGDGTVVNIQLVETTGATQVWSDRLELPGQRAAVDEAALVSSLTLRLRYVIQEAERRRANATAGSPDASAMDFVLRADALRINSNFDLARIRAARKLYDEALRMDPGLTAALIGRAWTFDMELWNDPRADYESLAREFDRDSARAVQLDARDAYAWIQREEALDWLGRHDAAKQANATARQLDPTSKFFLSLAAWETVLDGEPDKSIAFLDQARAIDRNVDANTSRVACIVEVYRANYAVAAPFCEKAVLLENWWVEYVYLTAAYAQSGDLQKAAASKAELLRLKPDLSIRRYQTMVARFSANPEYQRLTQERVLAGLRKAGVPE